MGDGADEIAELGISAEELRSATAREAPGAADRVRALVRAFCQLPLRPS